MRRRKSESGQTLILFLAAFAIMSAAWAAILLKGAEILDRVRTRNAADAISLSAAVVKARGLNVGGTINSILFIPAFQVDREGILRRLFGGGGFLGKSFESVLARFYPPRFWAVWNPLTPKSSAEATKRIFELLFDLRNKYVKWGLSGAPAFAARETARANGVVLEPAFSMLLTDGADKGFSLSLDKGEIPVLYFGTYKTLPVLPYSRGERNEPLALRDKKRPRGHVIRLRGRSGVTVYSAARPVNRHGPMFPTMEERRKMVAGLEASVVYWEAMNGGWDARLVPARSAELPGVWLDLDL